MLAQNRVGVGYVLSEEITVGGAEAKLSVPRPAQSIRSKGHPMAPSIIGEDLVVNGTLSSPGDIQVDGRIEGSVRCASLVIGAKAVIHGDVFAQNIAVRGRIEGNVRGNMIQLSAGCHIEGDVF